MGYARLGVAYGNQGAFTKAIEYLKKAYDLRERVTERERMYIESQYALQQFDLPKALQSYKLFVATYPRDAAAWNNLANAYGLVGDMEQALAGFKKTWEIAKWNNVAANNAAGTLIGMDRLQEGERYLKEAVDQGGSDDTNYHSNAMMDDFLSNRPDWDKHVQWAAVRPDGFNVEAGAATDLLFHGQDARRRPALGARGAESRAATSARCRGRTLFRQSSTRCVGLELLRGPRFRPPWSDARPFRGDCPGRRAGPGPVRRYRPGNCGNTTPGRGSAQQYPGQRNLPARSEGCCRASAASSGAGRRRFCLRLLPTSWCRRFLTWPAERR